MAYLNKDHNGGALGWQPFFSRHHVWLWYLDTYWLDIKETDSEEKYSPNLSSGNQLPQVKSTVRTVVPH